MTRGQVPTSVVGPVRRPRVASFNSSLTVQEGCHLHLLCFADLANHQLLFYGQKLASAGRLPTRCGQSVLPTLELQMVISERRPIPLCCPLLHTYSNVGERSWIDTYTLSILRHMEIDPVSNPQLRRA